MPWRRARWWSMRLWPRSAKGSRRSRATASSGEVRPWRTPSSNSFRPASSTSISCPTVTDPERIEQTRPGREPDGAKADAPGPRIGFLGPRGTFHEAALQTQDDLARAELVPFTTIQDVLAATAAGELDLGFC